MIMLDKICLLESTIPPVPAAPVLSSAAVSTRVMEPPDWYLYWCGSVGDVDGAGDGGDGGGGK